MKRIAARVLLAAVFLLALIYVGDWAVFHLRRGPTGEVEVNQFLATPLKGNKVEYDFMGVAPITCSRSIFPQGDYSACWWVERHKTHWD